MVCATREGQRSLETLSYDPSTGGGARVRLCVPQTISQKAQSNEEKLCPWREPASCWERQRQRGTGKETKWESSIVGVVLSPTYRETHLPAQVSSSCLAYPALSLLPLNCVLQQEGTQFTIDLSLSL